MIPRPPYLPTLTQYVARPGGTGGGGEELGASRGGGTMGRGKREGGKGGGAEGGRLVGKGGQSMAEGGWGKGVGVGLGACVTERRGQGRG